MDSTFWSHTVWYLLLGILTFIEMIFVMVKAKRRKLAFGFFLSILGITLFFETGILIFLKSYEYYPMIIRKSPNYFDDVLAGNLFSQFSVSATLLLVAVFDLKYYWYFIFAGIYGIIEEFFIALGIYSHNWYRTWMTVVTLIFAFWAAKKLHRAALKGLKPMAYYVYIFLGLFSLYVITILWGLQVAGIIAFSTTFLKDPINSRYFLALSIFFTPQSLGMMVLYFSRVKWFFKASIIACLYALCYVCYRLNLFWVKEGWFPAVAAVTILWMYLSVLAMDKLYGRNPGMRPHIQY